MTNLEKKIRIAARVMLSAAAAFGVVALTISFPKTAVLAFTAMFLVALGDPTITGRFL